MRYRVQRRRRHLPGDGKRHRLFGVTAKVTFAEDIRANQRGTAKKSFPVCFVVVGGAAQRHKEDRGFTMPELIAVLVIIGIVAAVAAPKLISSSFDEVRLQQQTLSALRYARSSAVSMQRTVCVAFAATSVTLTYNSTAYDPSTAAIPTTCATGLSAPGGGPAPYVVQAQGSATFSSFPASLAFDRLGRPYSSVGVLLAATQTITLNNGSQIAVEPQSGYAH
jgi:MSHA pilin protein MshC